MSQTSTSTSSHSPETCPICGRTLAHPDELDEQMSQHDIYRAHRRAHYSWGHKENYDPDSDPYLSQNVGPDIEDERLEEDCIVDTQHYEVKFHTEHVERVVVEASNSGEAKQLAEHKRTYKGEFRDTIHTDKRPVGEPSQASIDYLEAAGLLPADHDVTPDDIEELVSE